MYPIFNCEKKIIYHRINGMEIEMTDIVRGTKAPEPPPTLAVTLLKEFSVLESNQHNLPERRGSHLVLVPIGGTNSSMGGTTRVLSASTPSPMDLEHLRLITLR